MDALIITAESKSELKLLAELAKKLGLKSRSLSGDELADVSLVKKIEAGMKSGLASREDVMKALSK